MSRARSALVAAVAVLAVATLVACPMNPAPQPPPSTTGPGWQPPPPPPHPDAAPGAITGAACTTGTDCQSGTCEGAGCGDASGVCVDTKRMCTMDLVAYCGCDGATFQASGSCPGKRFKARGACAAVTQGPPGRPDGAQCSAGGDCLSGTCEGQGCGDAPTGTCAPAHRACTKDRRDYCGCDGQTFSGSGTCPGQRFAHKGAC